MKLGFRLWSPQEPTRESGKADSVRWKSRFKDPMGKGKKVAVENVRGGEDLWDAAAVAEQGSYPEHLVIMVNGLVGRYMFMSHLLWARGFFVLLLV